MYINMEERETPKDTYFNRYMKDRVNNTNSTINKVKEGCDHNPNSPTTSLIKTSKRVLCVPPTTYWHCSVCGKPFSFIFSEGEYVNIKQ